MMNDHQLFDVAQDFNRGDGANHVGGGGAPSTISNDEGLVMTQLEEMIGTAPRVAAGDDAYARAGSDWRIMVPENVLDVVLVGGFEIVWHVRIE